MSHRLFLFFISNGKKGRKQTKGQKMFYEEKIKQQLKQLFIHQFI